jgi:hypothetical protein
MYSKWSYRVQTCAIFITFSAVGGLTNGVCKTIVSHNCPLLDSHRCIRHRASAEDLRLGGSTIKYWELSTAQAGARGVRYVALIHYPSCTDSIKPSLKFLWNTIVINASEGSLCFQIFLIILPFMGTAISSSCRCPDIGCNYVGWDPRGLVLWWCRPRRRRTMVC